MSKLIFNQAFDMGTIPPRGSDPFKEGCSQDVLIDVDGNRKTFRVGCYILELEMWVTYDESVDIDLEHAKWMYLPLAENDDK